MTTPFLSEILTVYYGGAKLISQVVVHCFGVTLYTGRIMRFDFQNRYVRITILWAFMTALIWLAIYFIFLALKAEFPAFLHMSVSMLGAGYVVYRFFAQRIG